MGSNTVIVLSSLQVTQSKDSIANKCSVESAVTESGSGYSTNANSPVLEPVNNDARQPTFTVWKMLEYAILSAVITMVWGFLALPTVLYYVVQQQQQVNASSENTTAATVANCSAVTHRAGESCREDLTEATDSSAIGTSEPGQTQTENGNTTLLNSSRVCSDGFYLDQELDLCRPQCGIWKPTPPASQAVIDTFTIMALCTAIICGSAFLILALLKRKQMMTFPKVIFLYVDVAVVLADSVVLIGFFDNERLFCSSVDLIESIQNSTTFCQLTGAVYVYVRFQVALWAFFYITVLFWAIIWPFHFREQKDAGRMKYIHIALFVVSVILPCVPTGVGLHAGYGLTSIPPVACGSVDADVDAYTVLLPLCILDAGSISMLMVTFWKILKQYRQNRGKSDIILITAEKKILALLLFYTIVFIANLLPHTHRLIARQQTQMTLQNYFLCEGSRSQQPDLDCNQPELTVEAQLPIVAAIVQGFLPVFLLILFVDFKKLKAKIVHCYSNI